MRLINFLLLFGLILSFSSCNKDKALCKEARDRLSNQKFSGTIFLCNAQPPDMDFLDATATVLSVTEDEVSFLLVSDNGLIDTVLNFGIECRVPEEEAVLLFQNEEGHEHWQYNQSPDRVSFPFSYPNCLDNTHFEGLAE